MPSRFVIKITGFLLFCLLAFGALSQKIYTYAGNGVQGYSGDGGPASSAELNQPSNIVFDRYRNMYVTDQFNNTIRKVTASSGIITTVAGNGVEGYSGDGGSALSAELNLPSSLAVDSSGNIYISDFYNNCIREVVNATGKIYTVAGTGVAGYSGDNGPATAAKLDMPHQPTLDFHGNLFIADENNNCIRKVNLASGIIITVAGSSSTGFYGDGGPATAAELHAPKCIAVDDSGNMFIADWLNNRIRKVSALTGIITTLAGNGNLGYSGDGGPAIMADVNDPYRVTLDTAGNFYLADGPGNRIRWVNVRTGIINTIAGNGIGGYSGDGGPAVNAELNLPPGLAFDRWQDLFIADSRNNRIREIRCTFKVRASVITNETCFGGNTGCAIVRPVNGTSPYSYLWSDLYSQITDTAKGLSAGTYTVNITDMNGCTSTAKATITQPRQVKVSILSTFNVDCFWGNNGAASISASQGVSPYTYLWSNSQTTANLSGLSAGTYSLNVTDFNGCTASAEVIITQPASFQILTHSLPDNGTCHGSAWLKVTGGTSPYSYKWTGGLSTDTITNLCEGSYCCTITDAHGCQDSVCATINASGGANGFIIYPNPNNGIFKITLGLSVRQQAYQESLTINIYNVFGEKVYSTGYQVSANNYQAITINLSDKPNGVYFYRVTDNNGSLLGEGKLIIAK